MYVTKNLLYFYFFLLVTSLSTNAILIYLRGKKVNFTVKNRDQPPIKTHNRMGF